MPGIVYGLVAGTLRSDHDVVRGMTEAMKSLASYLVLAFFAAQFIAYFHWTNLGVITAVGGARFIAHFGLHESPTVLMLAVVVFAGLANLVLASASAKWALMAPVLVPMFMLLGYAPELVQAAYGIGDSVTNVITPMLGYFPLVLAFAQRYEPKAGLGTVVALMLPYSLAFLLAWSALLVAWIAFGIPVGPGRGSAAGSMIAYAMGITDIDPIKFKLLFERFLNPERVSPPDIDVDFCVNRRGEVIDYVRKKYGERAVSMIITFGTLGAKSVVRDVARVQGWGYGDADRLAKMIPNELGITLRYPTYREGLRAIASEDRLLVKKREI